MPRNEIQAVEVSYLVHSTEDLERLVREVAERLKIGTPATVENMEGHFGNKIFRVSHEVVREEASRLLSVLVSGLGKTMASSVLEMIPGIMDDRNAIYLRLDKQELLAGRMALGSRDPVRIKVVPRSFLIKGDPRSFYAGVLGLQS